MAEDLPIVISASRRTDIPAFYMEWFFQQLQSGAFEVQNPFNHRIRKVSVSPREVHTFVFWSKNFGPFLKEGYGERLRALGYHLFFNFSINSENTLLEPNVPSLTERLYQLGALCRSYGPESVTWRFDPICFYRVAGGEIRNNLKDFDTIAAAAGKCGVSRCVTSFLDLYAKVEKRSKKCQNITFEALDPEAKATVIRQMAEKLKRLGIALSACCEKELLAVICDETILTAASCIPNDLLMDLYGGRLTLQGDKGQRVKAGCGCKLSVDIGSYGWHPCRHNCLFCYANPDCDRRCN